MSLSTHCFVTIQSCYALECVQVVSKLGEARWYNLDRRPLHHRGDLAHTQIRFCVLLTVITKIETHIFQQWEETTGVRESIL